MPIPDIIKWTARRLRVNQTESEKKLWDVLRRTRWDLKVYRQKPIPVMREDTGLERYIIADFYFPQWKLVVEVDGSIHTKEEVYLLDKEKEKLLQNVWCIILRFTNHEVLYNTNNVIKNIAASLSL
jgi:very-short-patch-repair endonuclease